MKTKPEVIEDSAFESINRWPDSRYKTLDGRAMEAQTLIEDAIREITGIFVILNRDVSYAVADHGPAIDLARKAHQSLTDTRDAVATLGSELDSLRMIADGTAKPVAVKGVRRAS